jgi:hypothetical protein
MFLGLLWRRQPASDLACVATEVGGGVEKETCTFVAYIVSSRCSQELQLVR